VEIGRVFYQYLTKKKIEKHLLYYVNVRFDIFICEVQLENTANFHEGRGRRTGNDPLSSHEMTLSGKYLVLYFPSPDTRWFPRKPAWKISRTGFPGPDTGQP
jgi:hypothetical protein